MTDTISTTPYGVTALRNRIDLDDLTSDGRRCVKAVTEQLLVVPEVSRDGETTTRFRVSSESARQYLVDLDDPERPCDCPDMTHNRPDGGCKHLRRVELLQRDDRVPLPRDIGADAGDYWAWFDARVDAVEAEATALEATGDDAERASDLRESVTNAVDAASVEREFCDRDDDRDDEDGGPDGDAGGLEAGAVATDGGTMVTAGDACPSCDSEVESRAYGVRCSSVFCDWHEYRPMPSLR